MATYVWLHWNTRESTMKDLIEYLILTIKKGSRRGIFFCSQMVKRNTNIYN